MTAATTATVHVSSASQDVPVLLTRGEYDEVSGQSALQVASALPSSGGQVVTFKNSGSYMHIGM
jgi:pimeloyl-ACP methyl ester carboxylesterase